MEFTVALQGAAQQLADVLAVGCADAECALADQCLLEAVGDVGQLLVQHEKVFFAVITQARQCVFGQPLGIGRFQPAFLGLTFVVTGHADSHLDQVAGFFHAVGQQALAQFIEGQAAEQHEAGQGNPDQHQQFVAHRHELFLGIRKRLLIRRCRSASTFQF